MSRSFGSLGDWRRTTRRLPISGATTVKPSSARSGRFWPSRSGPSVPGWSLLAISGTSRCSILRSCPAEGHRPCHWRPRPRKACHRIMRARSGHVRQTGGPDVAKTTASEGTRILKDWGGATHEVLISGDGGATWNGQSYSSLSAVARAMTGTNRNGPKFFGVRDGSRRCSAGAVPSTPASRPKKGWIRTSTRWMRSARPVRLIS
ncbi:DUF2924 domain-containing protein [Ruegeria alba]|uniref:DUF2924 domain-containing protein n=1 Tax=Ruegeria alba TaxID=2916756 RepID=UPI003F7295F6